ncbi:hypothetical protein VPNG_02547 [Cytospora leucostoma]|uniref:Phospholipase/carboxylesterase/thioesterase domain-containing protein n=1 Tax=Cytospora leucostoma TaxID=1230097 RepID=A0A423XIA7_9PEZI|nr:hypothetical protein VPNG_02547 [Cytospora leucostoma]
MAPRIQIPKAEDFTPLAPDLTVSLHFPSPPESMTAILILFHGLGDSEVPFASFARNVNLPGVLAISVRGISPLPPSLLGLPLDSGPTRNFHWGDDVNLAAYTDGLDADPGYSKAADLITNRLIKGTLVDHCGWELSDILLFGFGQGGSLALGLASKLRDTEASKPFKGVVSIGGALPASMIPSVSGKSKAKTPVLICHGKSCEAVDEDAIDVLKREFVDVRDVRWKKSDSSMPSNRDEMLPIMQFFAERLRSGCFVATDNGVVGAATNLLRGGWEYSRLSALKALDKSEVTQGWILPCITYGKTQSILVQARRGREGGAGEAKAPKSNGCNQPCIRYAAICTALPWFGGGILAHKQCNEVGSFYNLPRRPDTAIDVLVPNLTAIRNLAEVRHRENISLSNSERKAQSKAQPKAQPFQPQQPMVMQQPPPVPVATAKPQVKVDVPEAKRPTTGSVAHRFRQKLKRKASDQPADSPKDKKHKPRGFFTGFGTIEEEDKPAQQVREKPALLQPIPQAPIVTELPPDPAERNKVKAEVPPPRQTTTAPEAGPALVERVKPEKLKAPSGAAKADDAEAEKTTSRFSGHFKKSKKPKEKEADKDTEAAAASIKKLNAEAEKATAGLRHWQKNIPVIFISEGPSAPKDEASEHTKERTEASESDQSGALVQTIVEIPAGARVHSLSQDTVVVSKPPNVSHRLSKDGTVISDKAPVPHAPKQDPAVEVKSAPHRVSQAAAPGHYLEGDPTISSPQQVFSHELLDDPVVQKRPKSPLPHTLESDKKVAAAAIADHANDPQAKEAAGKPKSKRSHSISQDVRVLSPTGRVLPLHTVDDDEPVKKTAHFPKSPHPNAMPGTWTPTASGTSGTE